MNLGIKIYRFCGLKVGAKSEISRGFYIDRHTGISIGNYSFLNYGVHCFCAGENSNITIGNNVYIGPEVCFCCSTHVIGNAKQRASSNLYYPIKVEDGCWIGLRSIILPNVTIAKGCIIAAGAVVTKSTDPNGLYAGIPAKRIKDLP